MAKVHNLLQSTKTQPAKVIFCKISLLCSIVFVANLAAVPLKVYITETFPWRLPSTPHDFAFSTYDYTDPRIIDAFRNLSKKKPNSVVAIDHWAYVLQYTLELPTELPLDDCSNYLHTFPGVIFYSAGIRRFCCNFLAMNATKQILVASDPNLSFLCQSVNLGGYSITPSCFWIQRSMGNNQTNSPNEYLVALGASIYEPLQYSWIKFLARSCMSVYILKHIWSNYYCHYSSLVLNLQQIGLGSHVKYVIRLGDPSYLVLSNSWVSVLLGLQFYLDIVFVGLASIRTSQIRDLWQFGLGCLYCSSLMWFGYMALRLATYSVKRSKSEHLWAPVDPGYLAIAASIYAGPLFFALSTTHAVYLIHEMLSGVPAEQKFHAIEIAPLCILIASLHGILPLTYSFVYQWLKNSSTRFIRIQYFDIQPHADVDGSTMSYIYNDEGYNDVKMRFVQVLRRAIFSRWNIDDSVKHIGGTLYQLYLENPRYKQLPFLSHRGSDCFVECFNIEDQLTTKARLSLLQGLDLQPNEGRLMLQVCSTCISTQSVCTINLKSSSHSENCSPQCRHIHLGAHQCKWVL